MPLNLPRLILRMRAYACSVLVAVVDQRVEPLVVSEKSDTHEVTILVHPVGQRRPGEEEPIPGRMLNDLETAVWLALANEPPLSVQAIANRVRRKNDNRLKYTLLGLAGRSVLVTSQDGGLKLYARAAVDTASPR
jgi:hypothetical protein